MIVVCDVDGTVVRTDIVWWKYLKDHYSITDSSKFDQLKVKHYDLSKYFPCIPEKERYEFWSQPDLYEDLMPMEAAVKALKKLSDDGHKILFASYCKKGHFGSKYDWLSKHFPFMDGFYATKEKQYIKADIFIDDRNDMLNKRYQEDPGCYIVKFNTDYTQTEELICPNVILLDNWKSTTF